MAGLSIEDKKLLARAEDLAEMAGRHYTRKHSGFLTPHERVMLQKNLAVPLGIHMEFWGGWEDFERGILLCWPEDCDPEYFGESPIAALKLEGRELDKLSHRDYLGSLLGLGLKREKIGDILPQGQVCYVYVLEEIVPYILLNLGKIGNTGVQVTQVQLKDVTIAEKKIQSIEGTVSSLRLDSVLALALNTSRSKAAEYLRSGRVMLNWETEESTSKMLKDGDMLSVRGFGRVRLAAVNGKTRKDRTHIRLEKYI